MHGGLAAAIARSLFEELTYDEGAAQNSSRSPTASRAHASCRRSSASRWSRRRRSRRSGAKGIGESGTIGATPAVRNAVIDALSPYGVRHLDMPVNGERVWRALQDSAARR